MLLRVAIASSPTHLFVSWGMIGSVNQRPMKHVDMLVKTWDVKDHRDGEKGGGVRQYRQGWCGSLRSPGSCYLNLGQRESS